MLERSSRGEEGVGLCRQRGSICWHFHSEERLDVKDGRCNSAFLCTLRGQGMREECSDLETGTRLAG